MNLIEALRELPLFASLGEDDLTELAKLTETRPLDRGEALFVQGEAPPGLYAVSSGSVRVYKLSPSGKEQTLHVFGPGHLVAEAAALAGAPLPATAEAAERSQLLFIPRRAFLDFLEARPALAVGLVEVLSQRLLRFAGLIENLSLRDVPARVAAYLLECRVEQGADEVRLDMSKGRLSTLLGTSPETLSRTLTRLAEAGAIEQMDNRRIRIAAPALLQGLESGETAL